MFNKFLSSIRIKKLADGVIMALFGMITLLACLAFGLSGWYFLATVVTLVICLGYFAAWIHDLEYKGKVRGRVKSFCWTGLEHEIEKLSEELVRKINQKNKPYGGCDQARMLVRKIVTALSIGISMATIKQVLTPILGAYTLEFYSIEDLTPQELAHNMSKGSWVIFKVRKYEYKIEVR